VAALPEGGHQTRMATAAPPSRDPPARRRHRPGGRLALAKRPPDADGEDVRNGAHPSSEDAFCRVVRVSVGRPQIEALAGAAGRATRRDRQAALEQAVMTSAWSSARPGEPASDWLRVVHPIDPGIHDLAPDRQLLLLVAGLRRAVAEAAQAGDERAKTRLALARESFGEPARDQIVLLLARAAAHDD
jgi:hypothetical protein